MMIDRLDRSAPIAVIGAGTMGTGIAQVAAVAGHPVAVYDTADGAAERAVATIRERVAGLVDKGRLDLDPARLRLEAAYLPEDLALVRCAIEAVTEDLAVKRALFASLEAIVSEDCVLATNTSSLSPTAIAAELDHPERLVGLHFFNPVPVMPLVEVVSGLATSAEVAAAVTVLVQDWGKQVVQAAATPGFIVNRVARPFYAEALRLAEEQAASPATIDAVLTQAGGFAIGPFALMDLIGQDVNEAVTRSVWTGFGYDPRFAPSPLQRAMVEAGRLGRKTGQGWYSYDEEAASPWPRATAAPRWPSTKRSGCCRPPGWRCTSSTTRRAWSSPAPWPCSSTGRPTRGTREWPAPATSTPPCGSAPATRSGRWPGASAGDPPRSWPCSTLCTPGTAMTVTGPQGCCAGSPPAAGRSCEQSGFRREGTGTTLVQVSPGGKTSVFGSA
jgi:3-hydroxyacyl-CoA dehydrogenase